MNERLEYLSLMTDDELLAAFGSELLAEDLGGRFEPIEAAKTWLDENLPSIRTDICCSETLLRFRSGSSFEGLEEAAAIMDVLASVRKYPAVATMSVLLARRSVRLVCDGHECP